MRLKSPFVISKHNPKAYMMKSLVVYKEYFYVIDVYYDNPYKYMLVKYGPDLKRQLVKTFAKDFGGLTMDPSTGTITHTPISVDVQLLVNPAAKEAPKPQGP